MAASGRVIKNEKNRITKIRKESEKGGSAMGEKDVPIWEKYALTIREVAQYFHIGEKKLREIAEENMDSNFVVKLGNRVLFKRKNFEEYLDQEKAI